MKKPTEAWRSTSLFEAGIGYVVACRDKANGNAEPGGFLHLHPERPEPCTSHSD